MAKTKESTQSGAPAKDNASAAAAAKVAAKKRKVKIEGFGHAHINASFNNIIVAITNAGGQVISWSSAGKKGFRGSKKNTPYAATMVAEDCGQKAFELGVRDLKIYIKGPGGGREASIRALHTIGFNIKDITDITPLPHNGCRPPKRRRI